MVKRYKSNTLENLGKLLLDIGKLTFASFILCAVFGLALTAKKTEIIGKE